MQTALCSVSHYTSVEAVLMRCVWWQVYKAVSDDDLFAFLDFCVTPSYHARVRRLR